MGAPSTGTDRTLARSGQVFPPGGTGMGQVETTLPVGARQRRPDDPYSNLQGDFAYGREIMEVALRPKCKARGSCGVGMQNKRRAVPDELDEFARDCAGSP